MASTAKVMTALAILDKKPLSPGQQGPLLTFDSEDADYYQKAFAQGESVLPVKNGQQISEYQALEALLVPSANNIAYSLSRWAFGSEDSYLTYANQRAKELGMNNTHFADASGFSPQTTSTARDLVILGLEAMKNRLISSVVSQSQANLPGAGNVKNVNWLLGTEGIVGIKTGNTDEAGGCFLLAAKRSIDNQTITVITAIMNSPDLLAAMTSAKTLMLAADDGFSKINDRFVATYSALWGATATATKNVSILAWTGKHTTQTSALKALPAGSEAGTPAGAVNLKNANYTNTELVKLDKPLTKPSFWWRIFHL